VHVAPGCKTTPDISIVSLLATNERSEALKFATSTEETKLHASIAIEGGMVHVNVLDPTNENWVSGAPPGPSEV